MLPALLSVPGFDSAEAANRRTAPYQQPEPPTPPDPPLPRPEGRLVPAEGALFGIHTTPDSPTAKQPDDMGITAMEASVGRTFDISRDDVVDWICADGYSWAPGKPNAPYQSFQSLFEGFYKFGNDHHKPLMIGETGAQENNPGDKPDWIRAMHKSVMDHYPNVVAFLHFDVDDSGSNGNYDWRLNSSPEAIGAFKDMALEPYFNQPHTTLSR